MEDVAAEDAPSLPPPPVVVVGGGERRANAGGTMNGTNAGETEIVVVDDDDDPPPARARRPPPPPGAQERPRAEARLRHLAPAVRYIVDALGSGLYRALCPRLRSVLRWGLGLRSRAVAVRLRPFRQGALPYAQDRLVRGEGRKKEHSGRGGGSMVAENVVTVHAGVLLAPTLRLFEYVQ